jgi:hypothetical protein
MAQRPPRAPSAQRHTGYSSEPVTRQSHWSGGFYTGANPEQNPEVYAQRPHGLGGFETNYGTASSKPRRIDTAEGSSSHVGKGPKGYKRTDERIRELICEALTHDPRIDARDVEVLVRDGELALTGSVSDRWVKYAIEELAEQYVHADRIQNDLKVRDRTSSIPWSDAEWPIGS